MNNNIVPFKVGYNLGAITNNLDEVAESVRNYCDDFKNVVFTADSEADGKQLLANIRRSQKELDDQRKQIKGEWNKPYKTFEDMCKKVIALYDEPIKLISDQLDEIDQLRKEDKMKVVKEIFDGYEAPDKVAGWYTFDELFDPRWLNKTFKEKDILKIITSSYKTLELAYDSILNTGSRYIEEGLARLKETKSIPEALNEMNRLKLHEELIERKKAEEEARKKAELERQEAERKAQEEAPAITAEVPDRTSECTPDFFTAPSYGFETGFNEELVTGFETGFSEGFTTGFEEPERTYRVTFRIRGDKDTNYALDFLHTLGAMDIIKEEE